MTSIGTNISGLVAASFVAASVSAHAVVPLGGDNESGLEFPSQASECQYYSPDPGFAINDGHSRFERFPYTALCAVPTNGGALNTAYMGIIKRSIIRSLDAGVRTELDLHQYGYIGGVDITTAGGESAFLNVHHLVWEWLKSNLTAAELSLLDLDLMNEPHADTDAAYQPVFQAAINQLRADGFTGNIYYPKTGYSGEHNITVNDPVMAGVTDPLGSGKLFLQVHQYFDPNYSGTTQNSPITDSGLGRATMAGAEAWSARTGIYLVLDETGDPMPITNGTPPASFPAGVWAQSDADFRQFMIDAANSGRYFVIAPFGGGQYWAADYQFNDYLYNGAPTADGQTYAALSAALGQ